mmetsp:Transcript_4571/g.16940  ORF Transcript_4571/g.16940 Transcript_4571/m.16940 type:complete len:237 (+) Transcript_4571:2659-3369(+)
MGSSSAVGGASSTLASVGNPRFCAPQRRNDRRSALLIPPMGLISAEEQSYLVMYPRRPSSTFALPSTRKKPFLPFTHGMSCANTNERIIRTRAWMFCSAKFSTLLPPSTLNFGVLRVIATKNAMIAATTVSILTSRCEDPTSSAKAFERLRVSLLLFSEPRYTVVSTRAANSFADGTGALSSSCAMRLMSANAHSSPAAAAFVASWHIEPTSAAVEELSAPPERGSKYPLAPDRRR